MTTSPIYGMTRLASAQAVPETTVNENDAILEAMSSRVVLDKDLAAPPGSPADGDRYIIAASPTGAWSGKADQVAIFVSTAWRFVEPYAGLTMFVADEAINYRYLSGVWTAVAGGGTAASLDYDTDGTLAANSDSKIATQKATKTYVDGKVAGLSWKQAVRAATTANGTLATAYENGDTVDGVTLATGDRVLLKNQSSGAENGIYVVAASGAPSRATDADSGAELVNASVYVSEGTANADTQWTCNTNAPITVGSTALTWATFTGGSGTVTSVSAGTGLSGGPITGSGSLALDTTHANAWTGKQDLGAGGDLTPAATPATNAIGYLGSPQNLQNGAYTTVMADAGKHIYHTSGSAHTWTIDSNANVAYPIGTILTFINENGGGVVTLAITSDTLRWGTATGSRSLAANGTATAIKVASGSWRLTGDGIT